MANVLSDDKRQQVLTLGRLGWSLRQIEEATGVRRETAGPYLRAAGIAVRRPGGKTAAWPPKPATGEGVLTDSSAAKPATADEVSTDSSSRNSTDSDSKPATTDGVSTDPRAAASPVASACEPFRDVILDALARGRNARAIWQDLVDDHGFTARYPSVQRFVRRVRGSQVREAQPVITTEPGQEAQVDYGEGPMVRDRESGKYRRTRLFVLTLGYSRKSVRLIVPRSGTRIWAELHERAFRRLGGAPRVVVLDNLREGVATPDIYDPTLNPLYRDVLAHYGVVALPCRVGDPDRKGKVESGVGHAQRTPLRGLRFESLDEAQTYLDRWEAHWADTRIHGTTKRQVAAMFAEERPALLALPVEPFRYYQYGERTVHLDGCVEVDAAYYGTPPGWIGRRVQVQWDGVRVRLLDPRTGQLLREHVRQERGRHRIHPDDVPPRTPATTEQLLRRARVAGRHIGALCDQIHRTDGEIGVKRILGVLSLARKHGAPTVDAAAQAALDLGAPTYRFLRNYLDRRPAAPLTLRQVDPLIRQLTLYRDVINRKTGETT
ncbi:MAG: IS21 family transposase [Solirubrobacterales bacterium]|nr:IS21 family transposase [Solirubrobacterales bacterium]